MKPDNKGYSLIEILTVTVIVSFLTASVIGAFLVANTIVRNSLAAHNLQRDVNVVVGKIIRGTKEGGNIVGLRSAKSFTIPTVTPSGSRINFVGVDDNTRSFFLSGNSIIYQSPTQSPTQKTIYTIPAGAGVVLRFWQPSGLMDDETVGIYFSVSNLSGGRMLSGALSTYVNIRNVPR